ncbi:DNA mismatch repair protein, partial [Pseudoalteromonas ruthenica]
LLEHVSTVFAIYLSHYKSIKLYVHGDLVEPESQNKNKTKLHVDEVLYDNIDYPYDLQIIEWNCNTTTEVLL